MIELSYTIRDEAGIHARPAGLLVKAMQQFESEITLKRGQKSVDLKKLFALMGMAVKQNETIVISADGPDEAEAIEKVKAVLEEAGL